MDRMDIKIRIGESVFRKTFSRLPAYWVVSEWYWRVVLMLSRDKDG